MPKDDQSTGFFSKFARFVRNPVTSWTDLDAAAHSPLEGEYSKQVLKEMIERKRRNDFVRKREFDMLRKLRMQQDSGDLQRMGPPSFFQSSHSSKEEDRAGTLRKIDEIEAQMSMQWWKTKQNGKHQAPAPPPDEIDSVLGYRTTLTQELVDVSPPKSPAFPDLLDELTSPEMAFLTSQPGHGLQAKDPAPSTFSLKDRATHLHGVGSTSFSPSKMYAMDVHELVLNPEIEEVAIRFASGDDAAAEQGLLHSLSQKAHNSVPDDWMVLFDFYRATHQVAAFESNALDFAARFSKSAPQWQALSLPEQALAGQGALGPFTPHTLWSAEDTVVTDRSIQLLRKTLDRSSQPWILDWTRLEYMDLQAAALLLPIFMTWCEQPIDLRFLGSKHLRDWLARQTPSGTPLVPQVWWELRLYALRIMGFADEFELVALDFCVTYEVSPPSWEAPLCHFKSIQAAPSMAGAAGDLHDDGLHSFVETHPATIPFERSQQNFGDSVFTKSPLMAPALAQLSGQVLGDAQDQLDRIELTTSELVTLDISCENLIRVDFSAAGCILNWVSIQQSQGRQVHFRHVHRLVAAFFHVIGIAQYAQVHIRQD